MTQASKATDIEAFQRFLATLAQYEGENYFQTLRDNAGVITHNIENDFLPFTGIMVPLEVHEHALEDLRDETINTFRKDNVALTESNLTLSRKVDEMREVAAQMQKDNNNLCTENDDLEARLAEWTNEAALQMELLRVKEQEVETLKAKLHAYKPHTVRDEVMGSLKMMGPLTGEELVARCELQVTEKVSGPMSWAVCDVLNRLIREKEVAIDGTCNAYDLAKNIMV